MSRWEEGTEVREERRGNWGLLKKSHCVLEEFETEVNETAVKVYVIGTNRKRLRRQDKQEADS